MEHLLRWLLWLALQALGPLATLFGEAGVLIIVFGAFFGDHTSDAVKNGALKLLGVAHTEMTPFCVAIGLVCIAASLALHIFAKLAEDVRRP